MNDLTIELDPLNQKEQLDEVKKAIKGNSLDFVSFRNMVSRKQRTEWLIRDLLDSESIAVLFGAPGVKKSFCAIDMGLCIATETEWHGHKVKKSGSVFYIAGEGFAGISRRLKAWGKKHNLDSDDIAFFVSNRAVDLSSHRSSQEVIDIIEQMTKEHGQPVLIIVDTLNRNFGPGDENSTADMTKFVQTIDYLKYELSCAVLIVHHSGLKEKGRARGNIALKGALDWEYLMKVEKGTLQLSCTKSKDYEPLDDMYFKHEVIITGIAHEDFTEFELITSVVLVLSDTVFIDSSSPPRQLSNPQSLTLEALQDLCSEGNNRTYIDQWRDASLLKNISTSTDRGSRKKAFVRSREVLLGEGYVETENDFYWIKDSGT